MPARWKIALILIVLVMASSWLLYRLDKDEEQASSIIRHDPDYFMENFTTTTMEDDGSLKNRLTADYLAHYPENNTTEITRPRLEVFRKDQEPLMIIADKGWITNDEKVILLTGAVKLWQNESNGVRKMEIITTDVRILPGQEYAETDKAAIFINKQGTTNAVGVRAFFKEQKIELLSDVQTTIQPEARD